MQSFDCVTLKHFVLENAGFFVGAHLQKIQQPSRRELVLTLRNLGETKKLYINIQAQYAHIRFIKDTPPSPKQAPMFCMLLRKYLTGASISKFTNIEQERILEIYFETYDEISQKLTLCLCVELMGKHSNIILYNAKSKIIIGCAHNISAEKSSIRELYGGIPYIYPPAAPMPFDETKSLMQNAQDGEDVNSLLQRVFGDKIEETKTAQLSTNLQKIVQKELDKLDRNIVAQNKSSKAGDYKAKGDKILNSTQVPTTEQIKKAQEYFKKYSKEKNAAHHRQTQTAQAIERKKYYEEILFEIQLCQTMDELKEIESILKPQPKSQSQTLTKKPQTPNIETFEQQGWKIYLGKNSKQNDYLISKIARGEDLWFHALNYPSSHVILKVRDPKTPPPPEILEFCAQLTKEHSPLKDGGKATIIYTLKKHLKRPPNTPLGYVTYSNEREIVI